MLIPIFLDRSFGYVLMGKDTILKGLGQDLQRNN